MAEPRDALPMAARYEQQAKAAVTAATKALGSSYNTAQDVAKIEAVGRVAAALILADRDGK